MTLLEMPKKGIKENPITNTILKEMVSDGLSEDEAMNIMISVLWNKMKPKLEPSWKDKKNEWHKKECNCSCYERK